MTPRLFIVFIFPFSTIITSCINEDDLNDFSMGFIEGVQQDSVVRHAQNIDVINLDSLTDDGAIIPKWEIKRDSQLLEDSTSWLLTESRQELKGKINEFFEKDSIIWLQASITKNKLATPVYFKINQTVASEIYVNQKKVNQFGFANGKVNAYNPSKSPFVVLLDTNSVQTVKVKLVKPSGPFFKWIPEVTERDFSLTIYKADKNLNKNTNFWDYNPNWYILKIGIFLLLTIIHLNFFITQRSKKSNLYFSLFSASLIIYEALRLYNDSYNYNYTSYTLIQFLSIIFGVSLTNAFLLAGLYQEFSIKHNKAYYILLWSFLSLPLVFIISQSKYILDIVVLILNIFLYVIIINIRKIALKQKRSGSKIFLYGILGPPIVSAILFALYIGCILIPNITLGKIDLIYYVTFLLQLLMTSVANGRNVILAVSLSLYISLQYTLLNKKLRKKLEEVDLLSKEKQSLLESQNEVLEQQVKTRTQELNNTIESLKSTQDQLIQKEKLASLGELTAGIAHEIQNPLNFVNNFSELSIELIDELKQLETEKSSDEALKAELMDDLAENQRKINHHGKRASNIVKGMLAHSRASTGERALTNINELADEYLRLSFHGMRAKDKSFNSDFKIETDSKIPKINVVPQDIGRVLLNLVNNAFYAVNEKSKQGIDGYNPLVVVKTELKDNKAIISVTDNGNGISNDLKSKIFQPFFTTKPTGEGTGLGLSLSYDIITKGHGGSLEVKTKEGEGTSFIINLPV